MEDLATARISVAQTAQRLIHAARCEDTDRAHDVALVDALLKEELASIASRLSDAGAEQRARYERSHAICRAWIERTAALDFRSLGAFTRDDLEGAA